MIKVAVTEEEKTECFSFLQNRGTIPITDCYAFSKNGEMKAVAGLSLNLGDKSRVGYIEPFQSDDNIEALKLYYFCEGFLRALDCKFIICMTNKEKTQKILERFGYKFWAEQLNHYIKEV